MEYVEASSGGGDAVERKMKVTSWEVVVVVVIGDGRDVVAIGTELRVQEEQGAFTVRFLMRT